VPFRSYSRNSPRADGFSFLVLQLDCRRILDGSKMAGLISAEPVSAALAPLTSLRGAVAGDAAYLGWRHGTHARSPLRT